MIVAAHGNVDAFCEKVGMEIGERHKGKVEEYAGRCLVLVTDNCDSLNEYYYLKYKLRKRGVELVSTHWSSDDISKFVAYLGAREEQEHKRVYSGRPMFGTRSDAEMETVRRIFELRDEGAPYRKIAEDDSVRYPDGRRMSISTIQVILKNREKYEKWDGFCTGG